MGESDTRPEGVTPGPNALLPMPPEGLPRPEPRPHSPRPDRGWVKWLLATLGVLLLVSCTANVVLVLTVSALSLSRVPRPTASSGYMGYPVPQSSGTATTQPDNGVVPDPAAGPVAIKQSDPRISGVIAIAKRDYSRFDVIGTTLEEGADGVGSQRVGVDMKDRATGLRLALIFQRIGADADWRTGDDVFRAGAKIPRQELLFKTLLKDQPSVTFTSGSVEGESSSDPKSSADVNVDSVPRGIDPFEGFPDARYESYVWDRTTQTWGRLK